MLFWLALFSLLDGAALVTAFAPFNVEYAAFFLITLFLFILMRVDAKKAFFIGLLFGLGFFAAGGSWVYISFHRYGNASMPLAISMTLLLISVMALFPAFLCYVFRRFFSKQSLTLQYLLIFPALWVIFELLRGNIFTGCPWILLGYTQLHTALAGFAPIIGVYGLSFLTVSLSGALLLIAEKKSFKTHLVALSMILFFFIAGLFLTKKTWTTPIGEPFKVSLIQGNIPQEIKWDPDYIAQNLAIYKTLTFDNLSSTLIVWPEGALPVYANDVTPFLNKLSLIAKDHHSNIILGAPLQKNGGTYNALLLLGSHEGDYLKKHLVPFGEYIPAEFVRNIMNKLSIPMSDFDAGTWDQPPLSIGNIHIAPFICYEIIFPSQVWHAALQSNVLLTASDDSWFGKSLALPQHLQMAQMRSLETGRPQLVATNTGITAFISDKGRIISAAPIDQQAVLTQMVQPMEGKTPVMWLYDF